MNHLCQPRIDGPFLGEMQEERKDFTSGLYSDVCVRDPARLWENGIVPFVLDQSVKKDHELIDILIEAIIIITKASNYTVKFVEKSYQKDFVRIIKVKEDVFWSSSVGKEGGEQVCTRLFSVYNTSLYFSLLYHFAI